MTLSFTRNKVVEVEPVGADRLSVSWRLVDSLLEAGIRLEVQLPDLEITKAESNVARAIHPACVAAPDLIDRVVGVRVGPGVRKIVRGLMGEQDGCHELADGVLECCNAVILHFTLPQIQARERVSGEEALEMRKAMLRANPRLAGSCIAYAEDSPLMQGLDL